MRISGISFDDVVACSNTQKEQKQYSYNKCDDDDDWVDDDGI